MKKQPQKELKNHINDLSYQISQLRSTIDTNEMASRTYNRLLIERACARKELKEMESSNILSFLSQKLRLPGRKKLISDYFNYK